MTKVLLSGLLAGLVGGFVGAYALIHLDGSTSSSGTTVSARSQEVVSARRIQLVDSGGKVRAELAMALGGGPSLFFFDSAGRNRLVLGLYSAAEGEAPTVVLNDAQQHAAGIFRLFGARDTPVVRGELDFQGDCLLRKGISSEPGRIGVPVAADGSLFEFLADRENVGGAEVFVAASVARSACAAVVSRLLKGL
jgi:hypothetical protein